MTLIFKYPEVFSYEIIKAKRNYLEEPEARYQVRYVATKRFQGWVRFGRPHAWNLLTISYKIVTVQSGIASTQASTRGY